MVWSFVEIRDDGTRGGEKPTGEIHVEVPAEAEAHNPAYFQKT
jgi:hypothetical protein